MMHCGAPIAHRPNTGARVNATPYAAATDVGQVRENNEDSSFVADTLWVVADGMGGHAGGEIASRLAVATAVERLQGGGVDADTLVDAFAAAHEAVLDASDDELAGMGTTMVLACRDAGGGVLVGNVGDSRAYLLADGELQQVTIDDNQAEVLLARGEITAEQARVHPGQYLLTASLGGWSPSAPQPAVLTLPAHAGRLLLCSDGVNSELTDEQIAEGLSSGDPENAAQQLVDSAVRAGGHDNVTVVVVDL